MQRSILHRLSSFAFVLLAGCPDVGADDEVATDGIELDTSTSSTTASGSRGGTEATTSAAPGSGEVTTMGGGESTTGDGDATSGDESALLGSTGDNPIDPGCKSDADCSDETLCNGAEVCVDGECLPGEPPVCGCGETCDDALGCGVHCTPVACSGDTPYFCGDCSDNDGDCLVDAMDPDCWGPCDNNEAGWNGNVPGQQNQSECNVMDCYFDANSGAGNDDCYWSHTCDALQPTWHDDDCSYDSGYTPPGAGGATCESLAMQQSDDCESVCGPLTPNGCDCFGCCELERDDGSLTTVYLGSTDAEGAFTCGFATAEDPDKCHPCTQVPACLNPCGECELCLGQVDLPPECDGQECPSGLQPCGLAGQDACPELQACITGCCVPQPQ